MFLEPNQPIVFGLTETHRPSGMALPKIKGYKSVATGRSRKRGEADGGGVGLYIRNDVVHVQVETVVSKEDDQVKGDRLWVDISVKGLEVTVGLVYISIDKYRDWNKKLVNLLHRDIESHQDRGVTKIILLGDFNADPSHPDHAGRLRNVSLLQDLIERCDLKILNLVKQKWMKPTWSGHMGESMIDLALCSQSVCRMVRDFEIDGDKLCGIRSDHHMISITIDRVLCVPKYVPTKPGWKIAQFRENGDWDVFQKNLEVELNGKFGSIGADLCADVMNSTIVDSLKNTADIVIGKRPSVKPNRVGYVDPFWDGQLEAARRRVKLRRAELQAAKRNQAKAGKCGNVFPVDKVARASRNLKEASEDFSKMLWQKKRNYDNECLAKVKNGRDAGRPFYNILQEREEDLFVRTLSDGKTFSDTEEGMVKIISEFWANIFASKGERAAFPVYVGSHRDVLMGEVSEEEVLRALGKMKNGKAPGSDQIPSDFIKNGGPTLISYMCRLFNHIINTLEVPSDWAFLIIRLLHKKGDRSDLNNTRPISLISNICKLFMRILTSRLESVVEPAGFLGHLQNGFRGNRGTSNNLFALSHLIEFSRKSKLPLFVAFLDLTKAYDSVEWSVVWDALGQFGIDIRFIRLLRNIYQGSFCKISLGQLLTEAVEISRGVRQGCIGSPLLFALVLSLFTRRIENCGMGAQYAGGRLPAQCYADDICLFANSPRALQFLLNSASNFARDTGLSFSVKKCKVIEFGTKFDKSGEDRKFNLNGVALESVETYSYLGVQLSNHKNYLDVFEAKILSRAKYYLMEVKRRAEASFSKYAVGRVLWKSMAVPALTYGLDCLKIRNIVIQKLDGIQNKMARFLLGAPRFAANAALQGDCGWSSFKFRVSRARVATLHRLKYGPDLISRRIIDYGRGSIFEQEVRDRQILGLVGIQFPPQRSVSDMVKEFANAAETVLWQADMVSKPTLCNYRKFAVIRDCCNIYDNHRGSAILFKFRANCFETLSRIAVFEKQRSEKDCLCIACELRVEETEAHIVSVCPRYEDLRLKHEEQLSKLVPGFREYTEEEQYDIKLVYGVEHASDFITVAKSTKTFLNKVVARRREVLNLYKKDKKSNSCH